MRIAIVGAGMAGLSAATVLTRNGHRVTIIDKGRGAGGRMAVRRIDTPLGIATFDHGAQYFTARDAGFAAQVQRWAATGIVARWPAAGDDAWVGTPAMNAPARALAAPLAITARHAVTTISRDGDQWRLHGDDGFAANADAVVIAVPAEQAAVLLYGVAGDFAARAMATRSAPCWTVVAAFPDPVSANVPIIRHAGAIGWAARDSAKPGRTGPEAWVLQASPDWSRDHLEDAPEQVIAALLREFARAIAAPLPSPIAVAAQRWRYARAGTASATCLWDGDTRIGVCGDWLVGPRVESAWLSGTALADRIG